MQTLGRKIRDYWLAFDLDVRPGVTEEDIADFESRYRVHLPADMRDYFEVVNGMEEGEMDGDMLSLWPLQEVKPIPEVFAEYETFEPTDELWSYFVFADFLGHAHHYAIRLSADPREENPVVWNGPFASNTFLLARSFSDFIEKYLVDGAQITRRPGKPSSAQYHRSGHLM